MKMRTAYLKVDNMDRALQFWEGLLAVTAHKKSKYWSELRCENINFGLLWIEGFETKSDCSNFIPVFELKVPELEASKNKVVSLGGKMIVDIAEHPDKMSYVFSDPAGNEFELTKFRD